MWLKFKDQIINLDLVARISILRYNNSHTIEFEFVNNRILNLRFDNDDEFKKILCKLNNLLKFDFNLPDWNSIEPPETVYRR